MELARKADRSDELGDEFGSAGVAEKGGGSEGSSDDWRNWNIPTT